MDVSGTTNRPASDYVVLAADEIDHAVLVTEPSGHVVYANRTFHSMFGFHSGDMQGRNATELLAAEGFDAGTMDRVRKELSQRRTFEEEVPVTTKAGDIVWMSTVV